MITTSAPGPSGLRMWIWTGLQRAALIATVAAPFMATLWACGTSDQQARQAMLQAQDAQQKAARAEAAANKARVAAEQAQIAADRARKAVDDATREIDRVAAHIERINREREEAGE